MTSADETVIELSRTKLVLLLLGSCAFVAAGVWLLTLDAGAVRGGRSYRLLFNSPGFAYGLGAAAVLFFGGCAVVAVRKMSDRKPGLVLNSTGVVDNASGVAAGLIPWAEVVGFGVFEMQKQQMLIVQVSDPEKYIGRGGALRRALNRANYKMTGSPVAIPSNTLRISFPELVALFERYRRQYGPPAHGLPKG